MKRLLLFLVLIPVVCSCRKAAVPGRAEIGKPAPSFSLRSVDGEAILLSDFAGKVVVLEFWATWCGPCRESVTELNDLHREMAEQEVVILGVSVDEGGGREEAVATFIETFGASYRMVFSNKETNRAYGVSTIPVLFILDRQHTLVHKYLGIVSSEVLRRDIEELLK